MQNFLLHHKVLEGNLDELSEIIRLGENVNELDEFGYSPLHWAVINNQVDVVMLLVKARADVNLISKQGLTPKQYAIDFGFDQIAKLL